MTRRSVCHRLDASEFASALAEISPLGDGEQPEAVLGWKLLRGHWTRLRAIYPNGWSLEVRLNAKGQVTSYTASLKVKAGVRK